MVIGAQKAGTTRLQHLFDTNEGYFCPVVSQEIHFFDRYYDRGEAHYLQLYQGVKPNDITVDVTPAYLTEKQVPERIKQFQENHGVNLKFILLIREPVSRLLSAYQMRVRRGYKKGLQAAIKDFEDLMIKSSYLEPLKKYIEIFGRENILILINEDMRKNFPSQCKAIQTFLKSDRPLQDTYGDKKVNIGGDRALPVLDRVFRKVGNFMRVIDMHDRIHSIKQSKIIQTVYKLNHRPVHLTEEEQQYADSLREVFHTQVLGLDQLLPGKDLLKKWGYESE